MKQDCTEFFLQYREVARLVWNLGFWPQPRLREIASVFAYEEAMTRLFEGLVLCPLGFDERVGQFHTLGKAVEFRVIAKFPGTELLVDRNLPDLPGHVWGDPVLRLESKSYQLRFVAFFDWQQLAPRDFSLLKVLIERMDERPDLVGHHALIELSKCSIS